MCNRLATTSKGANLYLLINIILNYEFKTKCVEHKVKIKLIRKIRDKKIIMLIMFPTSEKVQNHNFEKSEFLTSPNEHSGDVLPVKKSIPKSH